MNGKWYCKPHFKQLFATKGNYSDSFGEDKPTAKWAPVAGYDFQGTGMRLISHSLLKA